MADEILYTEEQELIASSARELLRERCDFDAVRKWMETESGYDTALWREIAELGWLGMSVPETYGGAGMGATEQISIFEAMGRSVMGSPFLSCALSAELLLQAGTDEQKSRWLPRLVSGETIARVAIGESGGAWDPLDLSARAVTDGAGIRLEGEKCFVLDGLNADLLLVACMHGGEPAVVLVEASQLPEGAMVAERLVDETRRSARVCLDGTTVSADALLTGGNAASALRRVQLRGALLISAEMAGVGQGVFDVTLDYLKTRVQFGKKIGGYQALKHPMVWIMVGIEHSRSLLYRAATLWDTGESASEIETAVRASKVQSGDACMFAVDRAIQFHGAFGFTWECQAQLFFRRAQWAEYTFGDAAHHRRHLAGLLCGKPSE